MDLGLTDADLGVLLTPPADWSLTVSSDFATMSPAATARPPRRRSMARATAAAASTATTTGKHKYRRPTRARSAEGKPSSLRTPAAAPARCGYRTGKCPNLQAVKRNGKLHKLCEFHREKANLNQKKLDRKKRLQRSTVGGSPVLDPDDEFESPRGVDSMAALGSLDVAPLPVVRPTSLHEAPLSLGCEELAIFCSLMTFDASQRPRQFFPAFASIV